MRNQLGFIHYLLLGIILIFGLSILVSPLASARKVAHTDDFSLVLKADKTTIKLGEQPKFSASITNHSNEDVLLVPALDGSAEGWRYPIIDFYVIKPKNAPEPQAWGRCGNMNNITKNDFIKVPKGKSFTPIKASTSNQSNEFTATGIYTVQLSYATDGKPTQWHGFMGTLSPVYKSTIRRLLANVPSMNIKSNIVTITVEEDIPALSGAKEIIPKITNEN